MSTAVSVFKPQEVRNEVIKQMESMQTAKFVQLPDNYKESAFFAIEKIASLEGIEQVPAPMITKALIKMFSNRLDFQKNHCYFFVQNDKESPTGKGLRFGWQYQGRVFVAKTTCNVDEVVPVLVHEGDEFSTHYEMGALIIDKHTPTFEGEIKGGYCVVKVGDGAIVKYYTKAELDKRRDKSMAKNGKFWSWEREMYEKTLINAVLNRIIETSGEVDNETLYDEAPEKEARKMIEVQVISQPEPTQPTTGEPEQLMI